MKMLAGVNPSGSNVRFDPAEVTVMYENIKTGADGETYFYTHLTLKSGVSFEVRGKIDELDRAITKLYSDKTKTSNPFAVVQIETMAL